MAPAPLSTGFQSFTPLPTIKLGPSGAGSRVGGLVNALGPCGSLQRPLLWGWEFLLLPPQPPRVFSVRGLRLYFPTLEPWLGPALHPCRLSWVIYAWMWGRGGATPALLALFSATLSPAFSVYLCANVGPQGLLVVRLPALFAPHSASLGPAMAAQVLSTPAACLSPSYRSGWKFLFLSPWCWTSLPLDFLSVLVVRGGTVCLPTPPSWFALAVLKTPLSPYKF